MMFLKLLQFLYFSRINENFILPIRSSADFISKQDIFYVKFRAVEHCPGQIIDEFFGVNVIDSFYLQKPEQEKKRRNG